VGGHAPLLEDHEQNCVHCLDNAEAEPSIKEVIIEERPREVVADVHPSHYNQVLVRLDATEGEAETLCLVHPRDLIVLNGHLQDYKVVEKDVVKEVKDKHVSHV